GPARQQLLRAHDHGPGTRVGLRARGPGLHDGLRRAAAHQLRALRSLHVRHVRDAVDRLLPRRDGGHHRRLGPRHAGG
ncbi:MAG: High-affinity branched-chain amino acid transport system permease protein LivH, partial [uncultured Nocardioidaceae bacterium]